MAFFSRVDQDRIKEAGPDRACAEWLLRCGASVKWKNKNFWEKDYNQLPGSNFERYKIEEIDATSSAIMAIGFQHLRKICCFIVVTYVQCKLLKDRC